MFTHFLLYRYKKTSDSQRLIVERSDITSFDNGLAQRNTEILRSDITSFDNGLAQRNTEILRSDIRVLIMA
jgi:hypothetical protein